MPSSFHDGSSRRHRVGTQLSQPGADQNGNHFVCLGTDSKDQGQQQLKQRNPEMIWDHWCPGKSGSKLQTLSELEGMMAGVPPADTRRTSGAATG